MFYFVITSLLPPPPLVSSGPDWCSLNLGTVFCLGCSGVHRSLGSHISRVRSLLLDSIDPLSLGLLACTGNTLVNAVYEADVSAQTGWTKPQGGASTPRSELERFIRAKYEHAAFVDVRAGAPASFASSPPAPQPESATDEAREEAGGALMSASSDQDAEYITAGGAAAAPHPSSSSSNGPPAPAGPRTSASIAAEQRTAQAAASRDLVRAAAAGDVAAMVGCLARGATQVLVESPPVHIRGAGTTGDGVGAGLTGDDAAQRGVGVDDSCRDAASAFNGRVRAGGLTASSSTVISTTTALHAAVAGGHLFAATLLCHTSGWSGGTEDGEGGNSWESLLLSIAEAHDGNSSRNDASAGVSGGAHAIAGGNNPSAASIGAAVGAAAASAFSPSSPLTVTDLSRVLPAMAQLLLSSSDRVRGLDLARATLMLPPPPPSPRFAERRQSVGVAAAAPTGMIVASSPHAVAPSPTASAGNTAVITVPPSSAAATGSGAVVHPSVPSAPPAGSFVSADLETMLLVLAAARAERLSELDAC